jgi:signal transduction histidine kinase/putative methionine-R-sulfoxide reductase with GAF domain
MRNISEIAILNEIRELLVQEYKDVHHFLTQVLRKVNMLIESDVGFIGLVEGEKEQWVVLRDKANNIIGAEPREREKYIERLKVGGRELPAHERSFIGYVAYTKKPRRSGDIKKEKYYRASNEKTLSELAVPILLNGEVLGVINLESKTPEFYTAEHEGILKFVAQLIARPLDSLMTREGFRRSPLIKVINKIREKLDDIPYGVSPEVSNTLNDIAEIVAEALNSRSCTIWLLNQAKTELILQGAHGLHRKYVNRHREKQGETIAWRAINQECLLKYGMNYFRDNVSVRYDVEVYGKKLKTPLIVTPLIACGKIIGVLKVGLKKQTQDNPHGCYTEVDEQLLNVIQGQVATAIELKQLEMEKKEQIQHQLKRLSDLLGIFTELDLKTVLERTVEKVPELYGGLSASIFLWEESRQAFLLAASKGLPSKLVGKAFYRRGEGLTGWIGMYGKSLILKSRTPDDLRKVDPNLRWKGKYNEVSTKKNLIHRPFCGVPIFRYGEPIGVIRTSRDRKDGFFTEIDVQLLTLVSSHISTAIAYCTRYEDRLKFLEKVQKLMTPPTKVNLDSRIDEFERDVLEEAAKSAAEVLKTDVLTLYKFRSDQGNFETPPIWKGVIKQADFMNTQIHPDDIPWKILREGSQYWKHAWDEPALIGEIPSRDGLPARLRFVEREGIVSSAGIRLEVGAEPVGVMFLNFRNYQSFDREKRKIIETFASQVALCLKVARIYTQIKKNATSKEAELLAQELHDALRLFSYEVVNKTGLALEQLEKGNHQRVKQDLEAIQKVATYCVQEIRVVMGLLRTPVDDLGLVGALKHLFEDVKPEGLRVEFQPNETNGKDEKLLSLNLKRHLYRIVQEAFNNVITHARARCVKITLDIKPDQVRLEIEDDGIGFDSKRALQVNENYGLKNIQARVSSLRGDMKINSQPGKGTRFVVIIPIEEVTVSSQ